MAVKITEVRSGAFVVLAGVVLVVLVFSVGRFRARLQETVLYHAYLSDAKFLKKHDPVAYAGIRVGDIREVEVSSDRFGQVKVVLEVAAGTPVRSDSRLFLKQDGMLGAKYVEISPGSEKAAPASPGAELQGFVPPAITDLSSTIEPVLGKLDRILGHLDRILGTPENQKNIADILSEARTLLASLNEQVKKVAEVATRTGERAEKVLGDVEGVVKETRAPLASTLKNADELAAKLLKSVDEMTARLNRTADGLDRLVADADAVVIQNNKNLYETIRGLRDTAYHLELAAKRIRANPSIVLFGAEETPEDLRRADETELRRKGRARRYDKEVPK
jgi:phospholipid/cholesterol/gamma-HCH transport system substrate-binding protein